MKRAAKFCVCFCALASFLVFTFASKLPAGTANARLEQPSKNGQAEKDNGDTYVYADFETMENNRPVSKHGGFVQILFYQQATPPQFKSIPGSSPPAPELVRLKKDDPNRAADLEYSLFSPNQYSGVGIEVKGQPDKDGKTVPDDMTGYKYISMQIYATGVPNLRIEVSSRGHGINLANGFPQISFRIKPGFNTYKIALNTLTQPSYIDHKVDIKEVLKNLTAVSLTAYCEGTCAPISGTVIVDNIVFQK